MTDIQIRIRFSQGAKTIKIPSTSTFQQLKSFIYQQTKIQPSQQAIKFGFPPKLIQASDPQPIFSLGITTGQTLILQQLPPKLINQASSSQTPDEQGKIMIRRIIPADNSCLFNSVAYALQARRKDLGRELRQIIPIFVQSDPLTYTQAYLGKPPQEYQSWILQQTSWGGAIQLIILSHYYQVQIAAVNIQNLRVDIYGESEDYSNRIYLIYDGIHYDAIGKNIEDGSQKTDFTVFNADDDLALQGVLSIAEGLRQKKQFTDTSKFALVCGTCYQGLTGQAQAAEHFKTTGHTNFQETSQQNEKNSHFETSFLYE